MNIKMLFYSITWIHVLFFPISIFFNIGKNYSNLFTLLLCFFLLGAVFFSLYNKVINKNPITYLMIFLLYFWIVFRLDVLLLFPNQFTYPYLLKLNVGELNFTIFMIAICFYLTFFGIYLSENICKKISLKKSICFEKVYHKDYRFFKKNYTNLLFIGLFNMIMGYIFYALFGLGKATGSSKILGILNLLMSYDLIIIYIFSYSIRYFYKLKKNQKFTLYVFIVFFIILRTLGGSKGGLFQVVFMTLFCLFLFHINYKFNWKSLLSSFFILPVSISLYILGMLIRVYGQASVKLGYSFSQLIQFVPLALEKFKFIDILSSISKRLSFLDYSIVLFNRSPELHFFEFQYIFKYLVNTFFLGSPFEEAKLSMARLFKTSYGFQSYSENISNYHTDMLPFFGHIFSISGVMGMIIATLLISIIFNFIFNFLNGYDNLFQSSLLLLLMYAINFFYFGMGIDSFINEFFFGFPLKFLFLISTLYILNSIKEVIKKNHKKQE